MQRHHHEAATLAAGEALGVLFLLAPLALRPIGEAIKKITRKDGKK